MEDEDPKIAYALLSFSIWNVNDLLFLRWGKYRFRLIPPQGGTVLDQLWFCLQLTVASMFKKDGLNVSREVHFCVDKRFDSKLLGLIEELTSKYKRKLVLFAREKALLLEE